MQNANVLRFENRQGGVTDGKKVIPEEDIYKSIPIDLTMRAAYLYAKEKLSSGDADTGEFWKIVQRRYRLYQRQYQADYFCSRCRWRERYQKCTSCCRNTMRRDLFEERTE